MDLISNKTDTYNFNIPEKIYQELYSKADILYFLLDSDYQIISFNVTAQEKLGYEKKELLGKKFLSLFCEENQPFAKKMLDTCFERGYVKDIESAMQSNEGRSLWVRMNGLTVSDEGTPSLIRIYMKDISDIIKISKQKDLSLRIVKRIQNGINSESSVKDLLCEIQNVIKSDGIGLSIRNQEGQSLRIGHCSHVGEQSDESIENFWKWPIETWKWLMAACSGTEACHISEAGTFWTGSLSDLILEVRVKKEKDYLVSLEDFESLVVIPIRNVNLEMGYLVLAHGDSEKWSKEDIAFFEEIAPLFSSLGIKEPPSTFTIDEKTLSLLNVPIVGILLVKNGIIQFANSYVEKFLGLPQNEIRGKALVDFFDTKYHDTVLAMLQNPTLTEESKVRCEAAVCIKGGKVKHIECACTPLSLNGSSMSLWYWIDKEDRRQFKDRLLQARKMESLGMLAGGIVHDFNNLLACILGYSSLLSEEIPKESAYYEDIQQITVTSEKASELTSRLLAYAQGGSYVVNALDLNQLIKEIAGILSRTFDKNITIRAELDPKLVPIKADASQIQQALLQVVLNARDAMPNGGRILFQTQNISLGENNAWLRLGGKPGNYAQITISDTGSGMSGEVKENLFNPNYAAKNRDVGKGLGLTMVQDIVKNHGGFISVFSERDKGTVFKIHLPAGETTVPRSQPSTKGKPPLGKETILLVDDEKVLRETARKMLTRYGYKVISADSGAEAIAIYKKYINRIDLIIMDLVMPGMEINKVFHWLKKLNPKVKIIAASGLGEKSTVEYEFHESMAGYIEKPFQVRPLLRKVRSVLNA